MKQKDLRRENKRIGVAVGDTEEKNGECRDGILQLAVGKIGYIDAEVARYSGVKTSSVNRLAVSVEVADLKKYLKML